MASNWTPLGPSTVRNDPNVVIAAGKRIYRSNNGVTLSSSKLRAATFGRCLWESPLYVGPVVSMQAGPKPAWEHFRAMSGQDGRSITLRFDSPRIQDLTCEILDLSGQRVVMKSVSTKTSQSVFVPAAH